MGRWGKILGGGLWREEIMIRIYCLKVYFSIKKNKVKNVACGNICVHCLSIDVGALSSLRLVLPLGKRVN